MRRVGLGGLLSAVLILTPALPVVAQDGATGGGETRVSDTGAAEDEASEADEEAAPEAPRPKAEGIEEIEVTARRRRETTFEAPVTITAFSKNQLETRNIQNLEDLTSAVPNFKFDSTAGSSSTSRIFARGVGQQEGFFNFDPKIGIYIDDVPFGRALGGNLDLIDLERVEFLPGSQASLFGKNSIGGSLNLVTVKPGPEFGTRVRAEVGNYHLLRTSFTANVPVDIGGLGESLFTRFTLSTATRDGFVDDTNLGTRVWDDKALSFDGAIRWVPTDRFESITTYSQSRSYENTVRGHCQFTEADDPIRIRNAPVVAGLPVAIPGYQDSLTRPLTIEQLGGNFHNECKRSSLTDETRSHTDFDPAQDLDIWTATHTMTYETPELPLLGALTLKSISGGLRWNVDANVELDNSSFPIANVAGPGQKIQQASQEFRASGFALDDRFDWVAGFFGMRETWRGDISTADALVPSVFNAAIDQLLNRPGGPPPGVPTFALPMMTVSIDDKTKSSNETMAGYFQGTLEATDRLTISGGARYATERRWMKKANLVRVDDFLLVRGPNGELRSGGCFSLPIAPNILTTCPRSDPRHPLHPTNNTFPAATEDNVVSYARLKIDSEESKRFSAWTGVANFTFELLDNVNLYGGWSRGFTSGGFNPISLEGGEDITTRDAMGNSVVTQTPIRINGFDPEILKGNEVGLKTRWLDDRLLLNLTYFYNRYDDMQQRIAVTDRNAGDGSQETISNTGSGTIQGLEFQLQARPVPQLELGILAGLIDARYRSFIVLDEEATAQRFNMINAGRDPADYLPVPPVYKDASNNNFPHTPPYTINLSGAYTFDDVFSGDLEIYGEYYMQGAVDNHIENFHSLRQGKYGQYNGRIAYLFNDGRSELSFWMRNIADRKFLSAAFRFPHWEALYFGAPRTWGISFRHEFGDFY